MAPCSRRVWRAGQSEPWGWDRTSANPTDFRKWLAANESRLKTDGVLRAFGNHRKYETLNALGSNGTGEAVETYVAWVGQDRSHRKRLENAVDVVGRDRKLLFNHLYQSMSSVTRFGRTARFDYLTMLGKLQLAPIEPGSPYLDGATGPFNGARLLFGQRRTTAAVRRDLERLVVQLGESIGVGMQELEDALCNWQKSPERFKPFRG